MIKNALLAIVIVAHSPLAAAHGQGAPESPDPKSSETGADFVPTPPPTYKANEVTVVEKLGARVPVETKFRRHDGNVVALGDVLHPHGNVLPTILTFNYSDCPMLCSLQLNGLTAAVPALAQRKDGALFVLGEQFRIVTISLEPNEDLAKLSKMREKYIAKLPENQREDARAAWTFLAAEHPGDPTSIKRVADAVGFHYTYIPERAEWAHPASLILLSNQGAITRYVHGIEFDDAVMRESIFKAGMSEPSTSVGFMNRCYHYDPDANNYSRSGVLALRVAAAGFVVLLLSLLGTLHLLRKSGRLQPVKGNPT